MARKTAQFGKILEKKPHEKSKFGAKITKIWREIRFLRDGLVNRLFGPLESLGKELAEEVKIDRKRCFESKVPIHN